MTVDLNGPNYAAAASPIYRAVWDSAMPLELFAPASGEGRSPKAQVTIQASLDVLRARKQDGKLLSAAGRLAGDLLQGDLARAGYWGLLIPRQYGGSGVRLRDYASFLTQVAAIDGSVANLLSVHSCLGPAGVVRNFGSEEQRDRWLPVFARGERLGVFALTEPGAGTDLTAVATHAKLIGDSYQVTGDKVFITNLGPGRVAALVCRIDGRPAILIAQLPNQESAEVKFIDYGIYAARRSGNRGMSLRDFEVPQCDLVTPARGDGLTIAYHGLNQGRMSLCAVAAGTLRRMLAGLLPWVRSRRTYGEAIGARELVQRRIGRLASLIVGCDALAAWCASLLDNGYRGELECMVAKIFAAEALKEATIEIGLRTYGGRSFLQGNLIGDSLHDLLAPCIYEGESEMLGLALMHSLCKPRPASPPGTSESDSANLPAGWQSLAATAMHGLRRIGAIAKRAASLGVDQPFQDQCEALLLSQSVQRWSVVLCVAGHARTLRDPVSKAAALGLAETSLGDDGGGLSAAKAELFRSEFDLGGRVIEEGWAELEDAWIEPIAQPGRGQFID